MGFNENDNNQILNTPITENEINLAIRNLISGKSAGLDGINEYITATMQFTLPLYTKRFNTIQYLTLEFYLTLGLKAKLDLYLKIKETNLIQKITVQ